MSAITFSRALAARTGFAQAPLSGRTSGCPHRSAKERASFGLHGSPEPPGAAADHHRRRLRLLALVQRGDPRLDRGGGDRRRQRAGRARVLRSRAAAGERGGDRPAHRVRGALGATERRPARRPRCGCSWTASPTSSAAGPPSSNGHKHCHARPELATPVFEMAQQIGVPVRSVSRDHRQWLRERGIATPDLLIGRTDSTEPVEPPELTGAARGGDRVDGASRLPGPRVRIRVRPGAPRGPGDGAARAGARALRQADLGRGRGAEHPQGGVRLSRRAARAGASWQSARARSALASSPAPLVLAAASSRSEPGTKRRRKVRRPPAASISSSIEASRSSARSSRSSIAS